MSDQEIATIFENLSDKLNNISTIIGTQGLSEIVQNFDGNSKYFNDWIKSIEKYAVLKGLDDNKIKLVAFQSSKGTVSDFICRYLRDNHRNSWEQLKEEISTRFGEIKDLHHEFYLLRNLKQDLGESVQIFGEKFINCAETAYENYKLGDNSLIELQLVELFTDNLAHNYLKLKLMREKPKTLQEAITCAMNEQNFRARFSARVKFSNSQNHAKYMNYKANNFNHYYTRNFCVYCKRPGHHVRSCRFRKNEIYSVFHRQNFSRFRKNNSNNSLKSKIKCWKCNNFGHIMRECRKQNFYDRNKINFQEN